MRGFVYLLTILSVFYFTLIPGLSQDRIEKIQPDRGVTVNQGVQMIEQGNMQVITPLPIDQILAKNQQRHRYNLSLNFNNDFIVDGIVDSAERSYYLKIGVGNVHTAEMYSVSGTSYGRSLKAGNWIRVSENTFAWWMQSATDILANSKILSVREEGIDLIAELEPLRLPVRDNPYEFYNTITHGNQDVLNTPMVQDMIRISGTIDMRVEMRIAKRTQNIDEVTINVTGDRINTSMVMKLSDTTNAIPPIPNEALTARVPSQVVSPMSLLLYIPSIQGWFDTKSHGPWTQRTIDLIEEKDKAEQKYTEIYNPKWAKEKFTTTVALNPSTQRPVYTKHHPMVLGSVFEDNTNGMEPFYDQWLASDANFMMNKDYFYKHDPYQRDYHHFGAVDTGLEYAWYFTFRGYPPTVKPGDRYYSAHDWGYGYGRINDDHNRLTYTEAIKQYNRYSSEGTRNAYLILGHPLHLFQDCGHPDHANNVAHPGSGMNEKEAFERYNYCHIIATELALSACGACTIFCAICSAAVFAAAEAACWGSADTWVMGYEKYAAEFWQLENIDQQISSTGVIKQHNYDDYFLDIGNFSIAEANKRNLESALGCTSLMLIPPVPNADPDIDTTDMSETIVFSELTDTLVTRIISEGAGFVETFFEIVNHPPIVDKVRIVQWQPGATPIGFGVLANDKDHCMRYDGQWEMKNNSRDLTKYSQMISLDNPAYIFIQFGPTRIEPDPLGRRMASCDLNLTGTYPGDGTSVNISVPLSEAYDPSYGYYYWGFYNPRNCTNDPYQLTLNINGKDRLAHYAPRNPSGDVIDSNPSTLAIVEEKNMGYALYGYEPGTDSNHSITVAPFQWHEEHNPSSIQLPNTRTDAGGFGRPVEREIDFAITQISWDCNWEKQDGLVKCSVEWKMNPQITKLGVPNTFGAPSDFGLEMNLTSDIRLGTAKLIITANPVFRIAGDYEVTVEYHLGEGSSAAWHSVVIPVDIM